MSGIIGAGAVSNSGVTDVFPAGHIIQVQLGETTTSTTVDSSSWTTATNLNVSITPTTAYNKIVVTVNMNYQFNNRGLGIIILRDVTGIRTFTSYSNYTSAGGQINGRSTYTVLDSPNTTSAITYSIKGQSYSGTGTINEATNYSEIFAYEVVT